VPDYHFALNHCADFFAEEAATRVELDMSHASGVLFHKSLVSKIQRRFVRIIISLLEKKKYEKKVPCALPIKPTLADILQSTPHNLSVSSGEYRCIDCLGVCTASSVNFRKWLSSGCNPLPYDDSIKVARIPSWHVIQIKNVIIHSTHTRLSFKGIIFCEKCGAFSAKRCRKLKEPCMNEFSVASQRAFEKLMNGELPSKNMLWPQRHVLQFYRPMVEVPALGPITTSFDDPEDFHPFDDE
jgi:hypothetical protein